jgi:ADP-heptose:LPS heptosyltransferase
MKILIVNLLRLGDVIAMAPAIKAIRGRFPYAEISLLVNSNFVSAARLIANVDQVISFERDRLQSSCAEAERPMFEAYDWLQLFVEELSENRFDLLYNFTHNRLSGWLCGLIEAQQKIGLVLDGSGAVSFGSAWFRHLNQQVDFDEVQSFNHTDVFIGAAGGWEQANALSFYDNLLIETESGRAEAASLVAGNNSTIVAFQISTSDQKKEWGDQRFRALAKMILHRHPHVTIYVLGAPDEQSRIEDFCRSVEASPEKVRPAILSLAGIISLLDQAELLVTGDTSIKHFASAATTRVVEIIAGSADAYRTGSWKAGDLIVASRELCAPCGHSEKCHRSTHACAIAISPEAVAEIVRPILSKESREAHQPDFERQNSRLSGDVQIFEVDRSEGPVTLLPVKATILTDEAMALCLERSARRLSLETRDKRFEKMQYGSEILAVKRVLARRFRDSDSLEIRHALVDGESRLRHAEGVVQSLKIQLARLKESFQDPKRICEMVSSVMVIRGRFQKNPWTRFIAEPLLLIIEDERSAPFSRFRKLSDAVLDLELRIEIGLKLIRGLETEFENESIDKRTMGDRP